MYTLAHCLLSFPDSTLGVRGGCRETRTLFWCGAWLRTTKPWHWRRQVGFKVQNLADFWGNPQAWGHYASGLFRVRTFLQDPLKRNYISLKVTAGSTFIFFSPWIAQLGPWPVDPERRDGEGEGEPGEGLPGRQSLWFPHQLRWAADPLPSLSWEPATCLWGTYLDCSSAAPAKEAWQSFGEEPLEGVTNQEGSGSLCWVYLLEHTSQSISEGSGQKEVLREQNSFFFFPQCFCPHSATCRILIPWPGIKPMSPALGVQSLNHWSPREVWAQSAF